MKKIKMIEMSEGRLKELISRAKQQTRKQTALSIREWLRDEFEILFFENSHYDKEFNFKFIEGEK